MKKLFEKQEKLVDVILINMSKRLGREVNHRHLITHDLLAVNVEVGEFLKEKDHKLKKLEYADILHALLSCGLALGIDESIAKHDISLLYEQSIENMYNEAVLNFITKFNEFANNTQVFKYWKVNREIKHNIEKYYFKCFLALFDIAKTMGYSVQDIKAAYGDKNLENIKRQQSNY